MTQPSLQSDWYIFKYMHLQRHTKLAMEEKVSLQLVGSGGWWSGSSAGCKLTARGVDHVVEGAKRLHGDSLLRLLLVLPTLACECQLLHSHLAIVVILTARKE